MKTAVKFFGIIALATMIVFTACSGGGAGGGSGGGGGGSSGGNGGSGGGGSNPGGGIAQTAGIKFNMTGAKAIMAAEAGSGTYSIAGRAAYNTNDVLFKVLDNDAVESLFDSSNVSWMPNVNFIARSPIAGKNDLYICFNQQWYYNNETISSFIHVREDGTIINIIQTDNNTWSNVNYYQNTDPVAFDGVGRMYFTASQSSGSSSTNVIYSYNPDTAELKPLTAATPNIWYSNVSLTSDGAYIVALGSRYSNNTSVGFLRLISVNNPDNPENLLYRAGGSYSISAFALNPQTKDIYVSGYNIVETFLNNWTSGVFKVNFNGASREWVPLFSSYWSYWDLLDTSTSPYKWHSKFMNGSNPDFDKIMESIYCGYGSDLIEFRYNNLTNQQALASLTATDISNISSLLENNIFKSGVKATIPDYSISMGYATRLFITGNNSLWGLFQNNNNYLPVFCQLLNSNGKRDFFVPPHMVNREIYGIMTTESHAYYSGSVGMGYQNIFRFSYNNPDTEENLFDYIHSRNTSNMEVYDFTVGGDYLYFSGTQGISLVTGKINMSTGVYTELEFGLKVNHIVAY